MVFFLVFIGSELLEFNRIANFVVVVVMFVLMLHREGFHWKLSTWTSGVPQMGGNYLNLCFFLLNDGLLVTFEEASLFDLCVFL